MEKILKPIQKKYLNWVSAASPFSSYLLSLSLLFICFYFEFAYQHSMLLIVGLLFSGWLVWGFIEYLTHRFVFHISSKNKYVLFLRYIMHGIHHHDPPRTLFVPVVLRVFVLASVFMFLALFFKEYVFLFFAGLEIGVIHYITVHYCLHHKKLSKYFPRLTKYHYIHHFVEPNTVFGTTTLVWDYVFGTLPSQTYTDMTYKENKHFILP